MMKRAILSLGLVLVLAASGWAGTQTAKGFFYKPDLGARGAAENNMFEAGLDRVDARLGKEIWLGDPGGTPGYDNLPHAIATIASTSAILRLPAGAISIADDTAIPANITLKPERGAMFSIAAGKTLTINGGLEAGLFQIFSGPGTVQLGGQSVETVYPEWWGAAADYSADNRTAFRAALQCLEDRGGGVLKLAARGNYAVSNGASPGAPGVWLSGSAHNITIEGNGAFLCGNGPNGGQVCNGPVLKLGEAAESGPGSNKLEGVTVKNLTITGAGSDSAALASYPHQDGLYIGNCSRVNIQDVYINNIARNGIAGKKNAVGQRFWNKVALSNVKVTGCGNAGAVIGQNNHDDASLQVADDIALFNCCFNGLGKAYPLPDSGYEQTQAGVILKAYAVTMAATEIASVNYTMDASYNDKVASGRFASSGWTYGAGWAQDAANYEADATTASGDLSQNLANMENTTYTVSFAVRNFSAGTVTPYIGTVAGAAVNANGSYCQTITTGATGALALKFTGAGFTGSITDVRVMKAPRGLNTGLYVRHAQALSINGLHCELLGANQLNSRDVFLEGCNGSVNGYSTYLADPLAARYGIYASGCRGLVINGANINSAFGYSLHNLVYFDGTCYDTLALGLSKGVNTGATDPFGAWVANSGNAGGIASEFSVFRASGGTYNSNIHFGYNDRYATLSFRGGTSAKVKMDADAANGDFYTDVTRKLYWRDINGNTKMTLDLSKGVFNLTALTAAPSSPTAGDIACADRATWDPLAKGSGGSYLVRYNGSAWVAIDAQ